MSFAFTFSIAVLFASWLFFILIDLGAAFIIKTIWGVRFMTSFNWGLLMLLIPLLVALYGYCIGRNKIVEKHTEVVSATLPQAFDGYRIVQISDLHLASFRGREEVLKKIVGRINALNPDAIMFTGDLVSNDSSELDGFEPLLGSLLAKDGVYSVLGNHDYLLYRKWRSDSLRMKAVAALVERERGLGWNLLLDSNAFIIRGSDTLAVIGVENTSTMRHFPSSGNLKKAMAGTGGSWKILLSHDPTHWDAEVRNEQIPLTLSGHTHALQFSLFGWCPSRYIFRQYRGMYCLNGKYLYVNIGLGETLLPIRVGAPAEITLIELRKESTASD